MRLHWQSLFRGTRCLHFLRFSKVLPNEFICFLTFPVTSTYLSASGLLRSQLLVSWSDALQLSVYFWQFSLLFSLQFSFSSMFYILKNSFPATIFVIFYEEGGISIYMCYSLSATGNIYLKFGCHCKDFYCFLKFIFYGVLSLKKLNILLFIENNATLKMKWRRDRPTTIRKHTTRTHVHRTNRDYGVFTIVFPTHTRRALPELVKNTIRQLVIIGI